MNKPFTREVELRWPNLMAMLAVAGLNAALPSTLLLGGPRWLIALIIGCLLVPILISHHRDNHRLNELLGYVLNGIVTIALILLAGRAVNIL